MSGIDLPQVSSLGLVKTFNRSRSLPLNAMRSSSIEPPGPEKTGHFYFAQTGHSHLAPTLPLGALTWAKAQHNIRCYA
jgi:hypothetical protein